MGLREGKNREIKNVLGALGLDVNRLIRVSYGPFQLGELPEGQVVEVRGRTLRDQLGPRLIEDAKANFDAPIYNAPSVAAEEEVEAKPARRERPRREEDKRERALGRLDTKRDDRRDDRREGGRRDDDRPKRPPLGSRRSANVWMAPGARPLGEKAAAKAAKNVKTARRRGEFPDAKPQASIRADDRPRAQVNRVREEDGEWIRSSEIVRKPKDEGDEGFARKRSFGDRPPREARSFGERPARGDRPFGGKPRADRRPREEGDERPRARGFAGEGRSERARSDKPFGDKPRGKSFGAKAGGKAFSGKPKGDRPGGGKPSGGAPRGGGKGKGMTRGADRRR
jgi:23S rRNA pseudouridine2605 synthase